jgi:hypothetical protein
MGLFKHSPGVSMRRLVMNVMLALVLTLPVSAFAARMDTVTLQDHQTVEVPVPEGFAPFTPEMVPFFQLAAQFVPESNRQLAAYVTDEDARLMLASQKPDLSHTYAIQVMRKYESQDFAATDFALMKMAIKVKNGEITKKVNAEFPAMGKKISENLTNQLNTGINVQIPENYPLPFHRETAHSLSYSTIVRLHLNTTDNKHTFDDTQAVTITFVHVKNRIVFLYVNGPKSAIEQTRREAAAWTDALLQANGVSDHVVPVTLSGQ